jgi:hypothetical protein
LYLLVELKTMPVHDVYAALKRLGLVANHASYSTEYLNMGPRYYDHLICSRRAPAATALLSLYVRVSAIADAFAAKPSLMMEVGQMKGLARVVWLELEQRSCALLPARRRRPAPTRVIQGVQVGACS